MNNWTGNTVMFYGANLKLRDARTTINRLNDLIKPPILSNIQITFITSNSIGDPAGTNDPFAFSEAFSSCIAQVRSIGDAILKDKEANKHPDFSNWRKLKKNECENDDLLKFINDTRNADLHSGFIPLTFDVQAFSFSKENNDVPIPKGADFIIDYTGAYWIVDQGTERENRIPCKAQNGISYTVSVINPPTKHKGTALPSTDPLTLCIEAEKYYINLLFEATTLFGNKRKTKGRP